MPTRFFLPHAAVIVALTFAFGCSDPVPPPVDPGADAGQTDGGTEDAGPPDAGDGLDWCATSFIAPVNGLTKASGEVKARSRLAGSCGGGEAGEATWLWRAPKEGEYTFEATSDAFTPLIYLRDVSCSGAELACAEGSLDIELKPFQFVAIIVDSADGRVGPVDLLIREGAVDQVEICDDGIDNTGNGLIDCQDPECINALPDSDGDGVSDICDICPGGDDKVDLDGNGIPDDCEDSCPPGTFGADCDDCPGGAATPCSGHGKCSQGIEGTGQCVCIGVWQGDACDMRCPGTSQICNGHGECNEQVKCECNDGYVGAACEACAPGYANASTKPGVLNCMPCPMDLDEVVCGGNGTCGPTKDGLNVECKCAPEYKGVACDECQPNRWGESCLECPGGVANACSKKGTCSDSRLGTGECICAPGYFGDACETLCPGGGTPNECSRNGFCNSLGVCECNDGFTGADCSRCEEGYVGPSCAECPKYGYLTCGGNGECKWGRMPNYPIDGSYCECDTGWHGYNCADCDEGYFGPNCTPCPGGGGSLACNGIEYACDDGKTGTGTCSCDDTGYFGADCASECPGGAANPCNSKDYPNTCADGAKGSGKCTCHVDDLTGFAGVSCSECAPGYFGRNCEPCECGPHGTCADGRLGTGACQCKTDGGVLYQGKLCDECPKGYAMPYGSENCVPCPAQCSGHGKCVPDSEDSVECVCDENFNGERCDKPCPGWPELICSGHGDCYYFSNPEEGGCYCDQGWMGDNCDTQSCDGYPGEMCSGRGRCDDGKCLCEGGFLGKNCQDCPAGYTGPSCDIWDP